MADQLLNETRREFLKISGQALSGVVVAGAGCGDVASARVGSVHSRQRASRDWTYDSLRKR